MPIHIEHIVTEVIPEPDPNESGESTDPRWQEREKAEAFMKQSHRYAIRLGAEAFDD